MKTHLVIFSLIAISLFSCKEEMKADKQIQTNDSISPVIDGAVRDAVHSYEQINDTTYMSYFKSKSDGC